jgi:hypothetical protein
MEYGLTSNQIHTWHNNQEIIGELLRVFSLSLDNFSKNVEIHKNTTDDGQIRYAFIVKFDSNIKYRKRKIEVLRDGEVYEENVDSEQHRLHIIVIPFNGKYNEKIHIYTIYVAPI